MTFDPTTNEKSLYDQIAQRDVEIARLKARVAELEQTNVFWLPGIESSSPSALPDCLELVFTQADLLSPIEMHAARKLRSWWYVLKRIDGENEEATLFTTKEGAEAFCQKERAKQGNPQR